VLHETIADDQSQRDWSPTGGQRSLQECKARHSLLQVIGTGSAGGAVTDRRRDLCSMRLQREMPRVEEADDSIRNIALERLGTGRQEERVVLPPDREQRRLVRAEIFVEPRVQRDVSGVVEEQIELDLVIAGPREQGRVERIA